MNIISEYAQGLDIILYLYKPSRKYWRRMPQIHANDNAIQPPSKQEAI